jgi:hypothetical protein
LDENHLSYDPSCTYAQDYELWVRMARYTQMANLPQVLLHYRSHPGQITRRHHALQLTVCSNSSLRHLETMKVPFTPEEGEIHRAIFRRNYEHTIDFVLKAEKWLWKLSESVQSRSDMGLRVIAPICATNLFVICNLATGEGWHTWRVFWRSPLSRYADIAMGQRIKFAIKCALRWTKK